MVGVGAAASASAGVPVSRVTVSCVMCNCLLPCATAYCLNG